ncbi:Outer membrane porin, OmpC family [Paraburkholderia unamae]|uniref:porin n=1 Tax=Paraburkholderia unamae TaxID=219649 RepID=UPI001CB0DB9D|nr:porin [Paraburkholderia unamae]CAG9266098.1 Outer membrane porin, OmpC family [Paraburkholderia unamae]
MKRMSMVILLASATNLAHAQSSVTVFGLVGGGIRWVNGTKGGATVEYSNILAPNRFGLTGSEDIGDGVKIIFRLENGFNSSNGSLATSNVLWSRAAYVGMDGTYGRLTMGRQFSSLDDLAIHLDPSEIGGADPAIVPDALLGVNYFTLDSRFNNSVKYTNGIGGAKLSASYSFGGVAGSQRAGSNYSVTASYGTGPIQAGIGYQRTYNADASQVAQNYYAGGSWQIGPVRAYLSYLALTVSGSAKNPSQRRDDVPQGGIVWQITPAIVVTAAYYDDIASNLDNVEGASGHKQTAYIIGEYFLSKRTELYVEADRNHFSGAYKADPTNLAVLKLNPGSSGITGVSMGMQTKF